MSGASGSSVGASGAGAGGTAGATLPDPATFTSGAHGTVGGKRGVLRGIGDRALDAWLAGSGAHRRIRTLAARGPIRDVLVIAIHAPDAPLVGPAIAELQRSRHHVHIAAGSTAELTGGKFENANALLAERNTGPGHLLHADWTLFVDDDVALPHGFLDGFIALADTFGFDLAQPAQTLASHAAWPSARRAPFAIARQTNFVEIGPVTAFSRRAADELLPFPDVKMGWGLDLHWSAVAQERGWRLGVVDALPVRHETRPVGGTYSAEVATDEAQRFLAGKPYTHATEAGRTIRTYRKVPR